MNALRLFLFCVVVGCQSTGSDVASLRDTDPTQDASRADGRDGDAMDSAFDAAVELGATPAMSSASTKEPPTSSQQGADAASSLEPEPADDVAPTPKGPVPDAGSFGNRLDAAVGRCTSNENRCTESGARERCNEQSGEIEADGSSCALQLFDGFDGYAVYARRSDGSFAMFSDVSLPDAISTLVESTRVSSIVPDTDPPSLQMPWWVDEDHVLRNALNGDAIENTKAGHSSHGFLLAVGDDGSVSVPGTDTRIPGDYVAALGHAENVWLLSSDGTLSPGMDAFTLAPRDWLPILEGRYQKVFALDLDICGLDLDGEVHCTSLDSGEWINQLPLGPFVDMTCNFRTCYLLDEQGDVMCFSPNLECVSHSGPFIDIATSLQLTCGIRPDASVGCWYHNGLEVPPESMPAQYR